LLIRLKVYLVEMINSILHAIENKKCLFVVTKDHVLRMEPYAYGMDLESQQALVFKKVGVSSVSLDQVKIIDIVGIHITEEYFDIKDELVANVKQKLNFIFSSLLVHSS